VVTGQVAKSGSVSGGALAYNSPAGPQTLSALVGWGGEEDKRKFTAVVRFETPSGTAIFNALLTKLP
jgi:hypothetical protein